ncbi:MAG TPA: aminoglycoside phosphotransferase family protein [Actinomycetota bacterium]|jgi:aminoglycoside phosphotransferase (APT) family kinase protein
MDQAGFPAATGSRLAWSLLPGRIVAAVEERLGSRIVQAHDRPGGFSPGAAARLRLADGRAAFVKAVAGELNPSSPDMHRAEARITAALPATAPVPGFLFLHDDGDWVALGLEAVDGGEPAVPWEAEELGRVLTAVADLHGALTPPPVDAPRLGDRLGSQFRNWRDLASGRFPVADATDPWAVRNLERLAGLESRWEEAAAGDTLLHGDLRADNILLTPDRVVFVDWPHAALGAPWVDLVFLAPSVAMQGGPEPEVLFDGHPSARAAPARAVDAVVAALAGYFHVRGMLPSPPGLPTLRAFQAAQGVQAVAWLRRRTGWD